jgi:hypothetical protein
VRVESGTIETGLQLQGLMDGEKGVGDELLMYDAELAAGCPAATGTAEHWLTEDTDGTGTNAAATSDHVDGGTFAGAVGTEQTEDFAGLHAETQMIHHQLGAEVFAQVNYVQSRCHGGTITQKRGGR